MSCQTSKSLKEWNISTDKNGIRIHAGMLERSLKLSDKSLTTNALFVDRFSIISESYPEFSVTFWKASPNAEPQGMNYSDNAGVEQEDAIKNQTDALDVEKKWIGLIRLG